MSENLARYNVILEILTKDRASKELSGMKEKTGGLKKSLIGSRAAMLGIVAAGAAAATGLGVVAKRGLEMAGNYETVRAQFAQLVGDIGTADDLLEALNKKSLKTPFTPASLNEGAKALLNYGIAQDKVLETVDRIGDLSLGDEQKFLALSDAYGKANARVKVTNETLELFANNGVPILQLLGQELGVTSEKVIDMASKGEINFKKLESAIESATSEGGRFFGALAEQSTTFNGLVSTLQGAGQELSKQIGQVILPFAKRVLPTIIDGLFNIIQRVKEFTPAIQTFFARVSAAFDIIRENISGNRGFQVLFSIIRKGIQGIGEAFALLPAFIAGVAEVNQEIGNKISNTFKLMALNAQIAINKVKGLVSASAREQVKILEAQKDGIIDGGRSLAEAFNEGFDSVQKVKFVPPEVKPSAKKSGNDIGGAVLDGIDEETKKPARKKQVVESIATLYEQALDQGGDQMAKIAKEVVKKLFLPTDAEVDEETNKFIDSVAKSMSNNLQTVDRSESKPLGFFFGTEEEQEEAKQKLREFADLYLQQQQEITDREISIVEGRIEQAKTLAERGRTDLLNIEEERLSELLKKRERFAAAQRQLDRLQILSAQGVAAAESIRTIAQAFASPGGLATGLLTSVALAAQIAIIASTVSGAFADIPGYRYGTEFLDGPGSGTSDSILIRASKGERITDAETNSKMGGFPNSKLPDAVALYKIYPQLQEGILRQMGQKVDSAELKKLNSKIDTMTTAIENMKMLVKLDAEGFAAYQQSLVKDIQRRKQILGR